MNRSRKIVLFLREYWPQIGVSLLFFWLWYLCFPFLPGPDPYGAPVNQWGIGVYILMRIIYNPLEYIMSSDFGAQISDLCYSYMDPQLVENGSRTFVYHLGACIATLLHSFIAYYSLLSIINALRAKYGHIVGFVICILLMIITCGFLFFVKNTDLFFCSTSLLVISICLKHYIEQKRYGTTIFVLLLLLISIAVGYRKNSIILLPLFIWMILALYHRTCQMKPLRFYTSGLILSIIAALPLSTSLLMPVLHMEDTYGEEVFMSSDYACMRLLKDKTIDLDNINGIKEGRYVLFMQNYERFGTCNNMKEKWINEIYDSPLIFFEARTINYAQFLSLGCLPSFVVRFLREKHKDIYFPDSDDFCTIVDFINNPRQRFEGYKHIHHISEFGNYKALFKRSLFNYDLFFNWEVYAVIIIIEYILSFICMIILIVRLLYYKCLTHLQKWILWCALLEFGHLTSFLIFTPTPDFRYHFFSIVMGFLVLGLFIINTHDPKGQLSACPLCIKDLRDLQRKYTSIFS